MAIKPILFNTEMVQAILDGRKTVTRRVVREKGWAVTGRPKWSRDGEFWFDVCMKGEKQTAKTSTCHKIVPPYSVSDIMWVRETWQVKRGGGYLHKADTLKSFDLFMTPDGRVVNDIPWRPSIHMPKEAARIFLRVTDVRAERLQDCGNAQAKDEGCVNCSQLARVWDSTIKPTDRPAYGWEANPWVWAIEFERCEKPEGWQC